MVKTFAEMTPEELELDARLEPLVDDLVAGMQEVLDDLELGLMGNEQIADKMIAMLAEHEAAIDAAGLREYVESWRT